MQYGYHFDPQIWGSESSYRHNMNIGKMDVVKRGSILHEVFLPLLVLWSEKEFAFQTIQFTIRISSELPQAVRERRRQKLGDGSVRNVVSLIAGSATTLC